MTSATELEIPFEGPKPSDPFTPVRGIRPRAWKMLVYGQPGVGKSSFAAHAPSPLFLDLESGLDRIDCAKTPERLRSLDEVLDWLRWIIRSREYTTVVIDTIDELEKFLAAKVVGDWNVENKTKVKTVADIPYGRGGDLLVAEWKRLLDVFDILQNERKNVLLVGHEQIVKFENPTDANYDFYTVNIHKKAGPVVTAKLDAVLYARYETFVRDANDRGKGKAVTSGERVLHTVQGASWVGKNRFGLPETMPMSPAVFEQIK